MWNLLRGWKPLPPVGPPQGGPRSVDSALGLLAPRWGKVGVGGILLLALALSAWAAPKPPTISGEAAFRHLERQVAFGPRVPGSEAHRKALDYFLQEFGRHTPHVKAESFTVTDGARTLKLTNVVATFAPGKGDPAMLAAHWDSRPRSDQDPHPEHRQSPTPGANDGASGVAVLLDVARALAEAPPPREVRLVLFDGEDWGDSLDTMFYGSREYVRRHPSDLPAWGILLDMVGDLNLRIQRESFSSQRARKLTDRVFATARRLGYGSVFENRDGPQIHDDHLPFLEAGVPFVDLIDFDYDDWHTVHDLPSGCSPRSLEIVGNVALRMVSDR